MDSRPPSTVDPIPAESREGPDEGADGRGAPLRLRVRGTSMRPAIADGDVVTVERPRRTDAIAAGEIASFRADRGAVITHRVLGRDESGGAPVLVTQGDGRTEPDAPWPEARLIGRVVDAERPSKGLPRRLLALERLAWWEVAERIATRLRAWRPVRTIQRRLFGGEMSIREGRRAPESGTWLAITCTALDAHGRPAGWQTAVRQGPDADTGRLLWLLFGLQVRLRNRGMGLGRRLLAAAEEAVAREGGGLLYAFVRPDNRPSVALFRSLGWRATAPPAGTVRAPELASCLCFTKVV